MEIERGQGPVEGGGAACSAACSGGSYGGELRRAAPGLIPPISEDTAGLLPPPDGGRAGSPDEPEAFDPEPSGRGSFADKWTVARSVLINQAGA